MAKKLIKTKNADKEKDTAEVEVELNSEAVEDAEVEDAEEETEGNAETEEADNAENTEDAQVSTETVVESAKPELFSVKLKKDLESYIGNKFYRFRAGEIYQVDFNVKSILQSAGYLQAL